MIYSKDDLVKRGKNYFNDFKVDAMYATEDGNFFYEKDHNYATSHAKEKGIKVIKITRADINPGGAVKGMNLETLQSLCETKEYPREEWEDLKVGKLREYVSMQLEEETERLEEERAQAEEDAMRKLVESTGQEYDPEATYDEEGNLVEDSEEEDESEEEEEEEDNNEEESTEEEESEEEESEKDESEEEENEEEDTEALHATYKEETGKNALYQGKETKAYQAWKKELS